MLHPLMGAGDFDKRVSHPMGLTHRDEQQEEEEATVAKPGTLLIKLTLGFVWES